MLNICAKLTSHISNRAEPFVGKIVSIQKEDASFGQGCSSGIVKSYFALVYARKCLRPVRQGGVHWREKTDC